MRNLFSLVIYAGALTLLLTSPQSSHAQSRSTPSETIWAEVWVESSIDFPLYDQLNASNEKLYASESWANGRDTVSYRERRLLTCLSTVYAMIEHSRGNSYLVGSHNYSDAEGSARLAGVSNSKSLDQIDVVWTELARGRPVILWGPVPGDSFGHFVLAVGVNSSGMIVAHDPIGGKRIEIDPTTKLVTNSNAISVVTQYRTVEYNGEVTGGNDGEWSIQTEPDFVIGLGETRSGYQLSAGGVATFERSRLGTIPNADQMTVSVYASPTNRFDFTVLKDEFFGGLFGFMVDKQSGEVWSAFSMDDFGQYGLQNKIAWSPDGTTVAMPLFQWEGLSSLLIANMRSRTRRFADPAGINRGISSATRRFEEASRRGNSWSPKLETLQTRQSVTRVEFKVETCNWDTYECKPSPIDGRKVEIDFPVGQSAPFAQYSDQFLDTEQVEVLVKSAANQRNYPSTNATDVIGTFSSGAILKGRWVRDIENDRRWLKIDSGGYVWDGNLAAFNETLVGTWELIGEKCCGYEAFSGGGNWEPIASNRRERVTFFADGQFISDRSRSHKGEYSIRRDNNGNMTVDGWNLYSVGVEAQSETITVVHVPTSVRNAYSELWKRIPEDHQRN